MKIRQARSGDVKHIQRLIKENMISRNFSGKTGLVEYPLQPQKEYMYRIKSELFLVYQQRDKISGFFASFNDEFLETLPKSELTNYILSKPRPFVYGDLIVVDKENRTGIISISLFDACFEVMKKLRRYSFYGATSHYPFKNIQSIKLAKHMGIRYEEEFALSNGLVFGIYNKLLNKE